jgi:hypothetical protein
MERVSKGSRTHTSCFTGRRACQIHHRHRRGMTNNRLTKGETCIRHSSFVIYQAARPGFEPGTPRSKRGMMIRFTIRPTISVRCRVSGVGRMTHFSGHLTPDTKNLLSAEGVGFEPTRRLAAPHGLANRPGEPYPAAFRVSVGCRVSGREYLLPPDTRHLTFSSGPGGSRTHHTDLARVSRPQRHAGPCPVES